jgi:hypothetical protein
MQQIPLQAVPNQQVQTTLDTQDCQIAVYQKSQGLFVDLNVGGTDISVGILALNGIPICPFNYAAFSGYLIFIDTQGDNDPTYDGLGNRYQLIYLTEDEIGDLI